MPGVSRLNDSIEGLTSGEHSGHLSPHPPSKITGYISGGCSPDVLVNGVPVATEGSITDEFDECCGSNNGVIAVGSSTVFVNNKGVARVGDSLNPHNGTASITGGSQNVISN